MKKAIIKGSIYVPFEFYQEDPNGDFSKRFLKKRVLENVEDYLENAEKLIRTCNITNGILKTEFITNYSLPVITEKVEWVRDDS